MTLKQVEPYRRIRLKRYRIKVGAAMVAYREIEVVAESYEKATEEAKVVAKKANGEPGDEWELDPKRLVGGYWEFEPLEVIELEPHDAKERG